MSCSYILEINFLSVVSFANIFSQSEGCLFILFIVSFAWWRKWQPTPVFLARESHGQRRLAGHSPWASKKSDTTEPLILCCAKAFRFNQVSFVYLFIFLFSFL